MVKTICYGEEQTWKSRKEAMEYFLEGIMACEGSEQERYLRIYTQLEDGAKVASDEEKEKVMNRRQIKIAEEYLDERYMIMKMEASTKADEVYYKGVIKGLRLAGYDYCRCEDKHVLIKM